MRIIPQVSIVGLLWLGFVLSTNAALGQSRLPFRDHPAVKAAFRQAIEHARESVCMVECAGKDAALGTIANADGFILTKASELKGSPVCKIGDQRYPAQIVGIHDDFDLAMLKIDASGLAAISWQKDATYHPGQWVITAGAEEDPLAIGVLSVAPRFIPASAMLGIQMGDATEGPQVVKVMPDSAASKAGLAAKDVITHIQDKRVNTREELIEAIRRYHAGKQVTLKIKRDAKELSITATLGKSEIHFQDKLGGGLSDRACGFPSALQHDTVLRPKQCGGPLLDLDGRVIGLNIARAGRVASYAIPAADIAGILDDLMSGKLAPAAETPVQDVKTEAAPGS